MHKDTAAFPEEAIHSSALQTVWIVWFVWFVYSLPKKKA
jgi:hypothetical protein